jgi:UDP-N-acetylmuramate dehydrogenase
MQETANAEGAEHTEVRGRKTYAVGMEIRENVALAPLTTFGIGGAARWFAEALTEAEVAEAVGWAKERGLPLLVLGGGSNLLVRDGGFAGLVVKMGVLGIEGGADGVLEVGAGESWDGLVDYAVGRDMAGMECLAGIPGSVGGTPVQNVGAYGQEVSETIESVRALDRTTGEFVELGREACRFRYRESLFNKDEPGRYVVTRVRFKLRVNGAATVKYAELRERLAERGEQTQVSEARPGAPNLVEVASVVREIRRGKGMLLVDGDPDCRSAGSFFKNPVVEKGVVAGVAAAAGVAEVPHWPVGEGKVKLPAAWLLERAGFVKGFGDGAVRISSRHTLALINRGGATFVDVERMEREIVAGVEAKFGVRLEREPVVVG